MYKIVLCCQNGASTDLLAVEMEKAAEQKGIEVSINAYPYTKLDVVIEDADLILLAPQVRFKLKTFEKQYADKGVPFMTVDPSDYGLLKGDKVLSECVAKIESSKTEK